MAEIVKAIDINAPVEKVFNYVADAHNALTYMPNFSRFQPVGQPESGLGAKVEAAGEMMGIHFNTVLEIIEFEDNRKLVSRSTQGIKSLSRWQFKPLPNGGTEVTFVSDYSLPGSMLGRLFDKLIMEKEVEKNTVQTLVNLKKVLEGKPNLRVVSSTQD